MTIHDPWYLSSKTKFHPAATVTCSCLLKQSRNAKRTVQNDWVLMLVQFFYSHFFNWIAIFGANVQSMVSQLTDQILPRSYRHLLASIKTEQQRKKNGAKRLGFDDCTVLRLAFFSNKLLFLWRTHDLWYLSSQTKFCPADAITCSCLLKQRSNAKRLVRNDLVLIICQLSTV